MPRYDDNNGSILKVYPLQTLVYPVAQKIGLFGVPCVSGGGGREGESI